MTVVSRYSKHRRWALGIALDLGYLDDDPKTIALVALWDASREYAPAEGAPTFRDFARPRIVEALTRWADESSA